MPNNAEAQRKRRLARRRCGGCGGPAAFMRYWRGVLVAIYAGCAEKLAAEGTESNASNQADMEAQMPPEHGSCISLEDLADPTLRTLCARYLRCEPRSGCIGPPPPESGSGQIEIRSGR